MNGSSGLQWSQLPQLPDTIGFGGPFAGTHNGALIVAGGANFPDAPPWEDGQKVWHSGIYVLETPGGTWLKAGDLPHAVAYGVSISTADGVVMIGGSDADRTYPDVLMLSWDPTAKKIATWDLPPLPEPAAFLVGGKIGSRIYAGTGKRAKDGATPTNTFWTLDLSAPAGMRKWSAIPDLPGPARTKAAAAVQSAGDRPKYLYVFGGETTTKLEDDTTHRQFHSDVWRFDPAGTAGVGAWKQMGDMPGVKAAACAIDIGQSHVLLFSGSAGAHIHKPIQERPLFPPQVLAYHAITDTWLQVEDMPQGVVTTTVTRWNGNIVIPSGETRPGVRTPQVQTAKLERPKPGFGLVNSIVLVLYLALLVGMGVYFSKREKTTEDFFLAGKRIPWWAAGLSIYATQLSAITFLASPAVAFSKNWLVYPGKITILMIVPIVIAFYLPFFRRLNITTAYEYLEKRFSLPVRLFGSASFVIFQLGRMAVVVYLPALALSTVTGMDIYACIVLMGVLSIVYTALGGMEAVVWTDVVQAIVLLGGMLVSVAIILFLEGGPAPIFREALADGKLHMTNWNWSTTEMVTWTMFIGTLALQFGPYTTDQAVIQRYLSVKDERAAAKGLWTSGSLAIPFGFLFFALGTCLYIFFKHRPELLAVGMKNDEAFPLFIVRQLPVGVSGVVIAGAFAASMSTLDSSMHSIATAITTDWYRRLRDVDDHQCLRLARIIVVAVGLFAMGIASLLVTSDVKSLFFLFQKILGLISSGLVGVFMLGVFTRRANSAGVLTGAAASFVVLFYVTRFTNTHFYLYAIIGILTCVVVGYVVSLLTPASDKNMTGLCRWTMPKETQLASSE